MSGGNINHVWRVYGESGTLIAKHAPPHIASNPDVPLSSQRITFEANALRLFDADGKLSSIAKGECRPPKLLAFDPDQSLLLMEDVGDFSELGDLAFDYSPKRIGERLGSFIGSLHKMTIEDSNLKKSFHNAEIQRVRYQLQYESAHEYASVDDPATTDMIKKRSQSLGQHLQKPHTGKCLLMGDLWPPSVLVNESCDIRLIDWEFVHFGRPLQDVGHFAAHCWMQGQMQSENHGKYLWKDIWSTFLSGYKSTLGSEYQKLIDPEELNDLGVHIGTEILVRAAGPFKEGSIYDPFKETDPIVIGAMQAAIEFIINPLAVTNYFEF